MVCIQISLFWVRFEITFVQWVNLAASNNIQRDIEDVVEARSWNARRQILTEQWGKLGQGWTSAAINGALELCVSTLSAVWHFKACCDTISGRITGSGVALYCLPRAPVFPFSSSSLHICIVCACKRTKSQEMSQKHSLTDGFWEWTIDRIIILMLQWKHPNYFINR